MGKKDKFFVIISKSVIIFSAGYLFSMLFIVYAVDIKNMNFLGISSWLETIYPGYPIFWVFAFKEGSPTEFLQWFFIGSSMFLAVLYIIKTYKTGLRSVSGWLLLLAGLTIMLYEDALNLRHQTVDKLAPYLGFTASHMFWFVSFRSMVEIIIYLLLGILMLTALFFILRQENKNIAAKKLLLTGYLLYGIAAVCSATREIGNWYNTFGNNILSRLYDPDRLASIKDMFHGNLGHHFIDYVFEESIELLGAAFICASLFCFLGGAYKGVANKKFTIFKS